ncbi:TM2 domain-containing protein [Chryseobacterium sp. 3008163]|uniref:TM2 domain-containing protein n=1 Tax=Chryseobacterium sp. 3008163 TaxID=2478663 RepID=UPI001629ABF1|nr:TM2 domain-containing protein [Chryseobacterium sp. 3008163]
MVQKKYRDLNSEQQRIFIGEFERRKKSLGVAYLLWILGGWYYAYLKKLGWLILFLLTAGGLFIWAIIDLFRIPKLIEDYNNDLALEILRDISIMFPAQENQNLDQIVSKKSVNDHYITQKTQSGESYSFFIIVGLIILFSISAFYFKPDRNQMQNKIVDDVMLHQPQLIKIMKNFFIGEELNEKYSETFITFFLSQNGYKNVGIYEEDLVLVRKLTFKDENSKENLLTAYGFLGLTKISYDNNGLQEKNIFDHRKKIIA